MNEYKPIGGISYLKLFNQLLDRIMKKDELCVAAGIIHSSLVKHERDKNNGVVRYVNAALQNGGATV